MDLNTCFDHTSAWSASDTQFLANNITTCPYKLQLRYLLLILPHCGCQSENACLRPQESCHKHRQPVPTHLTRCSQTCNTAAHRLRSANLRPKRSLSSRSEPSTLALATASSQAANVWLSSVLERSSAAARAVSCERCLSITHRARTRLSDAL